MTYAQLPKQPKPGVTLYCPECGSHFSAYRGDYVFANADPTEPILCGARAHDGAVTRLVLVRQHHAPLVEISPVEAEEGSAP